MAYLGAQPNKTLTKTTSQSFNGTGSATTFTLNRAVNTGEELEVFVENVQQEPGSSRSYTATGTTLTFDEAPPSGTGNIYVIYRGLAEVTTRLEHDANAALSATTGTFSGAVSGTTGTFTGDLTVDTNTLKVDSTNNRVGIGSASPTAALSVHDSANQSAILRIKNDSSDGCHNALTLESSTSADKNIGIRFKNQDAEKGGIGYVQSDKVAFYNGTSTSNGITIDTSGNVGLNTTSPNSNALLHVSGTASSGGSMGGKGIMLSYGSGNSAPIYFGTETDANAKAMYMEGFYLVIRGHDNEGIKFDGSGSSPVTRYRFDMGNAGNDCFNASNSSSWNTTSDNRIKENVQTLPDGSIAKIKALRPVTFDYTDDWAAQKGWYNYTAADDDPHDLSTNGFNLNQKNNDIGWIAQEYATVFPQDVHDRTETVNGQEVTDFKTMKPDSLVPHLVKALQEAIAKIETLETKVAALEGN